VAGDVGVGVGSGLMDDADGEGGVAQQGPTVADSVVERAGAAAAASDEDVELAVRGAGRHAEELAAYGKAAHLRAGGGKPAGRSGEAEQGSGDEAGDQAVGEAGDRVRLHDDDRDLSEEGGEDN